jgi:hypothetical protein
MEGVTECSRERWKALLKISRKQITRNDKEGKKERKKERNTRSLFSDRVLKADGRFSCLWLQVNSLALRQHPSSAAN